MHRNTNIFRQSGVDLVVGSPVVEHLHSKLKALGVSPSTGGMGARGVGWGGGGGGRKR